MSSLFLSLPALQQVGQQRVVGLGLAGHVEDTVDAAHILLLLLEQLHVGLNEGLDGWILVAFAVRRAEENVIEGLS